MGKKRKIGEGYLSTDRQKSYQQQLDEADPNYKENKKIDNIYDVDSEKVLVGRVASGTIEVGQEVIFHPSGKSAVISQIKKFEENVEEAEAGESIGSQGQSSFESRQARGSRVSGRELTACQQYGRWHGILDEWPTATKGRGTRFQVCHSTSIMQS